MKTIHIWRLSTKYPFIVSISSGEPVFGPAELDLFIGIRNDRNQKTIGRLRSSADPVLELFAVISTQPGFSLLDLCFESLILLMDEAVE